jgi:hypothetical protein
MTLDGRCNSARGSAEPRRLGNATKRRMGINVYTSSESLHGAGSGSRHGLVGPALTPTGHASAFGGATSADPESRERDGEVEGGGLDARK